MEFNELKSLAVDGQLVMASNPNSMVVNTMSGSRVNLASNIADVLKDTDGRGLDYRTYLIQNFPLVAWLMGTSLTARERELISPSGHGLDNTYDEGGVKYIKVAPDMAWSNPMDDPEGTTEECCWVPFDFAKCGSKAPLNLLCLKDSVKMLDFLIDRDMRTGVDSLEGISANTVRETQKNVAKLSMAFLTALNIIQGSPDATVSNLLKKFNGLAYIMSNTAIPTWNGTSPLTAFQSLGCRLALVRGNGDYIFAVHPMTYQSLLSYVQPGINGELPANWTREGDEIKYMGIGFLRDNMMPFDISAGTGEVWMLNGENIGCFMGTNLIPAENFMIEDKNDEQTYANGCMKKTTYYYNYGACITNNLLRLGRVVNIPITTACAGAASDLANLINPRSIAPNIG